MHSRISLALLLLLPLIGCSANKARPTLLRGLPASYVGVKKIDYNGWSDAWRLRNDYCNLIIVPAVSRIMHFSTPAGPNLLWENPEFAGKTFPTDDHTWHNIGGDKLWPTQQNLFGKFTGLGAAWPPPWPWDAGPSLAEPIANGVRLTLPHDKRFGAHAVREITLDPDRPLVHIRQWIEKTEGPAVPMTIWMVTQVNDPIISLLPSEDGTYSNLGPKSEQIKAHPGHLTLGRDEAQGLKIGVGAAGQNGYGASVFATPAGKVMLVQSHKLVSGAAYPDKGLQAELFTSANNVACYTEMELLSPLVMLNAGEKLEDDAVWQLMEIGEGNYAKVAAKAHEGALEWLKFSLQH